MAEIKKYSFFFILAILFVVSLASKVILLGTMLEPAMVGDDYLYKQNALSYFHGMRSYTHHYPPLYSLIIAPAFLFPDNFHFVMQKINALFGSIGIIPVYLLGRHFKLPPIYIILACLFYLLLPFHVAWVGWIMTESVFPTMFLFVFYLCVIPFSENRKKYLLQISTTGILSALMLMTRFQALALIPAIAVFLVIKKLHFEAVGFSSFKKKFVDASILIGVYLLTLISPTVLWLYHYPELPARLLGIAILYIPFIENVGHFQHQGQNIYFTLENFLVWLGLYISYVAWMVLPTIPIMIFAFMKLKEDIVSKKYGGALLLTVLFTGVLVFVSALHSFMAVYNYPAPDFEMMPQYILGRYVMYIGTLQVLWVFIFCNDSSVNELFNFKWFYEKFQKKVNNQKKRNRKRAKSTLLLNKNERSTLIRAFLFIGASIAIVFSTGYLIFEVDWWTPWFLMAHNGAELYMFVFSNWLMNLVLVVSILSIFMFVLEKRKCAFIMCVFIAMSANFIEVYRDYWNNRGTGSGLTQEVFLQLDTTAQFIVLTEPSREVEIRRRLAFWNTMPESIAESSFNIAGRESVNNLPPPVNLFI